VTAIRLPAWSEILTADGPWALMLRSRATGLWLLRYTAEEVDGLEVRIVDGARCSSSEALLREWASALAVPGEDLPTLAALGATLVEIARLPPAALAVLVTDAERLLEDEPAALPTLLDVLRGASGTAGGALRVVFQVPAGDVDQVAVFHEFDVVELA
jgi:hypothetical protein